MRDERVYRLREMVGPQWFYCSHEIVGLREAKRLAAERMLETGKFCRPDLIKHGEVWYDVTTDSWETVMEIVRSGRLRSLSLTWTLDYRMDVCW